MTRSVLQIPANPHHVRTARLVAVAAARQANLTVDQTDAVGLATDEACVLALGEAADWNQAAAAKNPLTVDLSASPGVDGRNLAITIESDPANFVIEVAVANAESETRYDEVADADPFDDIEPLADREITMTVLRAVAPEVVIEESTLGFAVRMAWPK